MDSDYDDEDEESGGIPPDLLASYLAFGVRAVAKRKWLVAGIFAALALCTVAAAVLWPRTYHCESRLMAQSNGALGLKLGDSSSDALSGAYDVIMRHENLQSIVKQTDLIRSYREHRPFILRLKDAVLARGEPSEKDAMAMLVGTLENKLSASTSNGTITISVDWQDAETAERLVEAAEENFLEARHVAEISTLAEYISILEGHAVKLRNEIESGAEQIQRLREEKLAEVQRLSQKPSSPSRTAAPREIRRAPAPVHVEPDEDLARLKVMLEAKKRTISELEDFRSRKLLELQAKMNDLLAKYTAEHPLVLETQNSIAQISKESPQVTALKAEVKDLEAEVKKRSAAQAEATRAFGGGGGAPQAPAPAENAGESSAEPLPAEIMRLMQQDMGDGLDPAIGAQFRYAVEKYATLRGQIGSARIDLDTAQAAFNHRYKIVVPPETPRKPSKPKVPVVVGAGLFASVLFALLAAVLAELRSGRIVERWQVHQISLPVLAELRFPPGSGTE
jgi:uncharacterized protein involved in exopolysaccharide biosynthesis